MMVARLFLRMLYSLGVFKGGPPVTMRLVEAVAAHLMIFDLEEHCSFRARVPSSRYIQCSLSLNVGEQHLAYMM